MSVHAGPCYVIFLPNGNGNTSTSWCLAGYPQPQDEGHCHLIASTGQNSKMLCFNMSTVANVIQYATQAINLLYMHPDIDICRSLHLVLFNSCMSDTR